jgi:hemoglobin-like flavoprotein
VVIFGASADLTPLVVAAVGLMCGSITGAIFGFTVGLFFDAALVQTMGLTSFVFVLAGYAAGRLRELRDPQATVIPMAVVTPQLILRTVLLGIAVVVLQVAAVSQVVIFGASADLTPLVYERLHREHPETKTMFRTEGSELVKGSMLALTIESILDFAGPRTGHFRMIECEISSHDAYGTPRDLFIAFFGVIAGTMREILDADWSPEIDAAWRQLLDEIEQLVLQRTSEN